jgi:hypothetical protein
MEIARIASPTLEDYFAAAEVCETRWQYLRPLHTAARFEGRAPCRETTSSTAAGLLPCADAEPGATIGPPPPDGGPEEIRPHPAALRPGVDCSGARPAWIGEICHSPGASRFWRLPGEGLLAPGLLLAARKPGAAAVLRRRREIIVWRRKTDTGAGTHQDRLYFCSGPVD